MVKFLYEEEQKEFSQSDALWEETQIVGKNLDQIRGKLYLLCDTLTSSVTLKTPDVTKLSWKPKCPVETKSEENQASETESVHQYQCKHLSVMIKHVRPKRTLSSLHAPVGGHSHLVTETTFGLSLEVVEKFWNNSWVIFEMV